MPDGPGELTAGLAWALSAWCVGGLLTVPLESLIQPHGGRWNRPAWTWKAQTGLWTLAFSLLLLLAQRPLFAGALALAGALLVVLVNNAKYRALREPFLFTDFGLFSQALRHPRLYLPFLGLGRAAAGLGALALSLYLGLALETALPDTLGWPGFLALGTGGATLGLVLLWRSGPPGDDPPTLQPERDLRDLGLAASLWSYWRLERSDGSPPLAAPPIRVSASPGALPHIVAVQSESFFDARRLPAPIRPQLLAQFDRVRDTALLHGRLSVPAWGANTMRTEFGFLTGIDADRLGVHRFNPYRRLARRPVPSLASLLRSLGYRTLCIHPHPASFFDRDRVYPLLGFDEFIDIRHFDRGETCGPYICDAAVTRMIAEILDSAAGPTFVFAITMENHGPLHLEQVAPGDPGQLYAEPPPAGLDDLTVYLRHLGNADRMIGELAAVLSTPTREGLLCWFGDHVPSMPQVYAATGHPDGRTDYLIWRRGGAHARRCDLAVEELGRELLAAAGLGEPA